MLNIKWTKNDSGPPECWEAEAEHCFLTVWDSGWTCTLNTRENYELHMEATGGADALKDAKERCLIACEQFEIIWNKMFL